MDLLKERLVELQLTGRSPFLAQENRNSTSRRERNYVHVSGLSTFELLTFFESVSSVETPVFLCIFGARK